MVGCKHTAMFICRVSQIILSCHQKCMPCSCMSRLAKKGWHAVANCPVLALRHFPNTILVLIEYCALTLLQLLCDIRIGNDPLLFQTRDYYPRALSIDKSLTKRHLRCNIKHSTGSGWMLITRPQMHSIFLAQPIPTASQDRPDEEPDGDGQD